MDQLRQHPVWQDLTPTEREAVAARLGPYTLDTAWLAAASGQWDRLEAADLRRWLQRPPWTGIGILPEAARVDAIQQVLLVLAPLPAEGPARDRRIDLGRSLSRALAAAEAELQAGEPLREEDLAALDVWIHEFGQARAYAALRAHDLGGVVRALERRASAARGVRGVLAAAARKLEGVAFDLEHGGLFLAEGKPEHEGHYDDGAWQNWSKDYTARPAAWHVPETEGALSEILLQAEQVRVVGGGHSFNASPVTAHTLISLDRMSRVLALDVARGVARVQAGIRLRDLTKLLYERGLGLPMLGSTDAQSLGGLVATDLHGTGRDHGFLSEQVRALRVVDARGEARTVHPGDPLFHAAFGAIGTCGVVTEVELQCVPAFRLAKTTQMVERARVEDELQDRLLNAEHLSFYYVSGRMDRASVRQNRWIHTQRPPSKDWEKHKVQAEIADFALTAASPRLAGAISDLAPDSWLSDRLVPDRTLLMPCSAGFGRKLFYRHDEIELAVPMDRWREALDATLELLAEREFLAVVEVRFTPDQSRALIGPGAGQRSVWIELANPLAQERGEVYAAFEDLLRGFGGRPHLGKKTTATAADLLALHGERFVQFQAVRRAQDPEGKFLNAFAERVLGG